MKPSEKHQAQTVGWNAKPAWIKQGGIPFSCRQHPEWGVRRNSGRRWPGLGAWLIVAGLLLPVAHPVPVTASPIVRAVGPQLQVGVDRTTGQIVELIDRSSQHNLAGLSTNRGGLWELEFADGGKLTPANARVCEATPLAGKPGGLHLEWRELGRGGAPELRVEVEVRLDPDQAVSHWQIALHNLQGQSPHLIRFPRLLEVPEQPGERLAVPVWLGQQAEHPRTLLNGPAGKSRRLEWSYPGLLSLQCVALTGGGGTGLYAACDDTAGYLKDFAVFGNGSAGFNLEILHRPENNDPARKTYALPVRGRARRIPRQLVRRRDALPFLGHKPVVGPGEPAEARPGSVLGHEHRAVGLEPWRFARRPRSRHRVAKGTGPARQRVLALVARLRLRRGLSRIPAAARRGGTVPSRAPARARQRCPRHRLHESTPLGHDNRQLDQ
ncbi:MAG: hypothetical protein V9H26_19025 [Verrucomicrobiota bacterium]